MSHAKENPEKKENKILRYVTDFLLIIVANSVYALGVNVFVSPNNIAPGGVTGVSVIISSITPIPVGVLIAGINIPLIILGFIFLNKKIMIKTLISVAVLSVMTDAVMVNVPVYHAEEGSGILAAIFGGLLMGFGLGLNYMRESTTGGTDIINKIINRFRPTVRLGTLILITDSFVVAFGFIVYRDLDVIMYAVISIFVQSKIIDMMVYGGQECKFMLIFSERYQEICERFLKNNMGVTLLKGEGAYSKAERQVIAAAVHKSDYVRMRRVIKEIDPRAFVVITGASEVLGEGFQKLE
ncbi:MAG: YitT family protein [Oscillospiraceae bacterium]|nr:YitT family protein [Oscillospiraceae bacterium]